MNILDQCFESSYNASSYLTGEEIVLSRGEETLTLKAVVAEVVIDSEAGDGSIEHLVSINVAVPISLWMPQRLDKVIYNNKEYIATGEININNKIATFYATFKQPISRHDEDYFRS